MDRFEIAFRLRLFSISPSENAFVCCPRLFTRQQILEVLPSDSVDDGGGGSRKGNSASRSAWTTVSTDPSVRGLSLKTSSSQNEDDMDEYTLPSSELEEVHSQLASQEDTSSATKVCARSGEFLDAGLRLWRDVEKSVQRFNHERTRLVILAPSILSQPRFRFKPWCL